MGLSNLPDFPSASSTFQPAFLFLVVEKIAERYCGLGQRTDRAGLWGLFASKRHPEVGTKIFLTDRK
jgi:hypothetical protein